MQPGRRLLLVAVGGLCGLHRRTEGVSVHSMHLEGRAIDVRLRGYPTLQLAGDARALGRGGVGYYARSDFVHVDTGRVRYW